MKLIVNGREKYFKGKEIGYDDVIGLAFPDLDMKDHSSSVAYAISKKPTSKETGTLYPGGPKIKVVRNMRFAAGLTWNA